MCFALTKLNALLQLFEKQLLHILLGTSKILDALSIHTLSGHFVLFALTFPAAMYVYNTYTISYKCIRCPTAVFATRIQFNVCACRGIGFSYFDICCCQLSLRFENCILTTVE